MKLNKKLIRNVGLALLAIGLILIVWNPKLPGLATVVLDSTPPVWLVAGDGGVAISPRDAQVISSLTKIQVGVADPESGVATVTATLDGAAYNLALFTGTQYNGFWYVTFASLASGSHSMSVNATNYNGLSTVYSASFTVYTGLQGRWFINGIPVTDPAQVLRFNSYTLNFTFVKDLSGVPDSGITCTCQWTGPASDLQTLPNVAANTWTGLHTFSLGGTYTVTLKATDGTSIVTFNLFTVDVGNSGGTLLSNLSVVQEAGAALTLMGLAVSGYSFFRKK